MTRADSDPTDRLIVELVRTGRTAKPAEIESITSHMTSVLFETAAIRVRADERGASYLGHTLGARADSLICHLVKRVAIERQWATGTTAQQYIASLRRAVRHPESRLAVYARRGGILATAIATTSAVLSVVERGSNMEANLLVVYSVDRGTIISGYQFSDLSTAGIPAGALWLK